MTARFEEIVRLLVQHEIKFIVVGGWAAAVHGSARTTLDLDVVYSRERENIRRLVSAVGSIQPYLRGAPLGLPFSFDEKTVRNGLNFTLTTSLGDLDVLGEVAGGGTYEQLLPFTVELPLLGMRCRCVTLERLIQLKRAAGRAKDLQVLAELEALLEERRKAGL